MAWRPRHSRRCWPPRQRCRRPGGGSTSNGILHVGRCDFKRPEKIPPKTCGAGYLSVAPRGPRRCRRNEVRAKRDEAAAEGKEKPLRHDGGLERPPELEQQHDERCHDGRVSHVI